MNPFGLSNSTQRLVAGFLSVAMALTPLSARADVGEIVNLVIEAAGPIKPVTTSEVRPAKPTCQSGACTGCTCAPCGPVGCCTSCTEVQNCQSGNCATCGIGRVSKPQRVFDGQSSEPMGVRDDECRAALALQSQVIRMVNQLSWQIQALQQQIQDLQQPQPAAARTR
jgi:hypothetical protein